MEGVRPQSETLSAEFEALAGRAWLNCAHQGPLPRRAAEAARAAIDRKSAPWLMAPEHWEEVPRRLKRVIASLIGARAEDVVLANSASYGLELLARTLPLAPGDEVLLVRGDFPATIYPWLPLRRRGVEVRLLADDNALAPERLEAELGPRTRVLCTSWVFSFSGLAVDIGALGDVCSARGTTLIINATQAVGARPLDLGALAVDALVCSGFKWLCGPYGTGFAWLSPALRDRLTYEPAYWLPHQQALSGRIERGPTYELADVGAAAYDLPDTANFIQFEAWTAALELLAEIGVERIHEHDQELVARLIDGLAEGSLDLTSPPGGPERSTLVFASHPDEGRNAEIFEQLREAGVDVALRVGALRFSPHLYNGPQDIDRALEVLAG
jgi:cysteine desulfurase/selenocysteine lyase